MNRIYYKTKTLWRRMMSMKFAIYLLCAVCAASLLAVLLPQSVPADFAGNIEQFYLLKFGPLAGRTLLRLGLHDIHGSWWYTGIMALLCFIICFTWLGRLPRIIRQIRGGSFLKSSAQFRTRKYYANFRTPRKLSLVHPAISTILRDSRWKVRIQNDWGGRVMIHAVKGAWSRMGMFAAHLGLVVVLVGAMVSERASFAHFQWLAPGETMTVPKLDAMASPAYLLSDLSGIGGKELKHRLAVTIDSTDWRSPAATSHFPAAARVKLDKFNVAYTTRGKPKAFVSSLTLMDTTGRRLTGGEVMVNHPLVHDGLYFYQSSFLPAWDRAERVVLDIAPADSSAGPWRVVLTDSLPVARIAATGDIVRMVQFAGTLAPDTVRGRLDGLPGEHLNPAVLLSVERDGEKLMQSWVMQNLPASGARVGNPYHVTLAAYTSPELAGITVRSHRAQSVIWLGLLMLVAGSVLAFSSYHRELWAMLHVCEAGETVVYLAGGHTRAEQKFSEESDLLADKIARQCGSLAPPPEGVNERVNMILAGVE